jgi:hypothetical protein
VTSSLYGLYDKQEPIEERDGLPVMRAPQREDLLREWSFVRWQSAIYNLYGNDHPRLGVLLLLRYFAVGGRWFKPPTYGVETTRGPLLELYDLPTSLVPRYGIRLGVGPADLTRYSGYSDPLGGEFSATTAPFAEIAGCPVGLSGSHALGLATSTSDLDLVLYGPTAEESGRRLLASVSPGDLDPRPLSRVVRRFFDLAGHEVRYLPLRNLFHGTLTWQGRTKKLDLSYALSEASVRLGTLDGGSTLGDSWLARLSVLDTAERCFSPGSIRCETASGRPYRVWIRDRTMRYLLPGDRVVLRGRRINSDEGEDLVGEEVVELALRR